MKGENLHRRSLQWLSLPVSVLGPCNDTLQAYLIENCPGGAEGGSFNATCHVLPERLRQHDGRNRIGLVPNKAPWWPSSLTGLWIFGPTICRLLQAASLRPLDRRSLFAHSGAYWMLNSRRSLCSDGGRGLGPFKEVADDRESFKSKRSHVYQPLTPQHPAPCLPGGSEKKMQAKCLASRPYLELNGVANPKP